MLAFWYRRKAGSPLKWMTVFHNCNRIQTRIKGLGGGGIFGRFCYFTLFQITPMNTGAKVILRFQSRNSLEYNQNPGTVERQSSLFPSEDFHLQDSILRTSGISKIRFFPRNFGNVKNHGTRDTYPYTQKPRFRRSSKIHVDYRRYLNIFEDF